LKWREQALRIIEKQFSWKMIRRARHVWRHRLRYLTRFFLLLFALLFPILAILLLFHSLA